METNVKTSNTIIAIVEAIIGIFMLLTVKVIAPVCTGMLETVAGKQVHMKCYYTAVAITVVAILVLVNAVIRFVTKQKMGAGIMAVALAICAFVFLNGSVGIGMCMNLEMACNVTAPYIKLAAGLEAVIGVVSIFLGMKESR